MQSTDKVLTPEHFCWSAIDTVVLDMDGTLLDLNFDDHVWNRLLPKRYAALNGIDPGDAYEALRARLEEKRGTIEWYRFAHWEKLTGVDLMQLERDLAHMIQPRPGAEEFLQFLESLSIRRILATNADRRSLAHKLEVTNIAKRFDTIVSSHDYGVAKEDPLFWQALISELDFDAARTLFIDDNHSVLETARRAGIGYSFAVELPNTRGTRVSSDQFYCLKAFTELTLRSD